MKKVIFLLLFPLIAETVISCCDCIEPVIHQYTNKTITALNLNNSGNEPVIVPSGTINKKAYGIRLELIREKFACLEKRPSLFIQSAYAMGCHCPPALQYNPKDSITAIKIFTQNNFDNDHPAGADISPYFKIYNAFSFTTIDDFIKYYSKTLYDDNELTRETDFLLMTAPTNTGDHQFKVQLTLSDGRVLETLTPTIALN